MPPTLTFYGWQRSSIYTTAGNTLKNGRLTGQLNITIIDKNASEKASASGKPSFAIMGPGDIAGIKQQVILQTAPRPFARDAEDTKLVHVDFAEPDLPWRYTPELMTSPTQLRPWITVLVGRADEMKVENNVVHASDTVYKDYNLAHSARWAHVQNDGSTTISRILSPRRLAPQSAYIAAIVPTFTTTGQDAWTVTHSPDTLPAYYWWKFWTAEDGDFATLASALRVITAQGLGKAPLHYNRGDVQTTFDVRGAITNLEKEPDPADVQKARDDLKAYKAAMDALTDEIGRKVIGLPSYGAPWVSESNPTTWTQSLNEDARYRGTAGLGLWMGIEGQETLVDAAVTQMGAFDIAAQRVRQLALGLLASRSLWTRRFPDDPLKRLMILSPLLRRMRTDTGTVMAHITGKASPLEAAMFSSAARRMLRHGTAQTKHSKGGLVARSELLLMFNQCPPKPEKSLPGLAHTDEMVRDLGLPTLEDLSMLGIPEFPEKLLQYIDSLVGQPVNARAMSNAFGQIRQEAGFAGCELDWVYLLPYEQQKQVATRDMLITANRQCLRPRGLDTKPPSDQLAHELGDVRQEFAPELSAFMTNFLLLPENKPCNPPDLNAISKVVADALDPTVALPPALKRVAATMEGIDISSLAPPQVPIGIPFPTWTLLNKYEKEWLLPGVGTLQKNAVVAMQTNPTFIDAYMIGINTQFMNEMHWRNIAVDRKSTPLRMFWGPIDFASTQERMPDIQPLTTWDPTTDLGATQHQVLPPAGETDGTRNLVLIFRTDLFRRYPSTLVYMEKTRKGVDEDADLKATPILDHTQQAAVAPKFFGPIYSGTLEPDLHFFAFDVNPDNLQDYWLVLDEPPSELRFRSVDDDNQLLVSAALDGATFATETFSRPTRVAMSGAYLKRLGLQG